MSTAHILKSRHSSAGSVMINVDSMEYDVKSLIADGETYTVKFKSDASDGELTEATVCLANGDGGRILIGRERCSYIHQITNRHD